MDFFAAQERARSHTRWLLVLFLLGVIATVAALDLVFLIGIELMDDGTESSSVAELFANHRFGAYFMGFLLLLVIIGESFKKAFELAGGGAAVARSLGATQVRRDAVDFEHKRLRNVVEEMAVAAGLPVPEIYVLDREIGINAFAAGWTPADAAIVVTRGALEHLDRDELQGVIAHEYSHILNGDMRLNIKLVALLAGLILIAVSARKVLAEGHNMRGDAALIALFVAMLAWAVGSIGLVVGQFIKATVSRQREFLADAAAVRMTRQKRGIAGALQKIAAWPAGAYILIPEAESVSHMLFDSGGSAAFATHPPLEERVRRIAGRFDQAEVAQQRAKFKVIVEQRVRERDTRMAEARSARASSATLVPFATASLMLKPELISAAVGRPDLASYELAEAVANATPPKLDALARGEDAVYLLLALPLDGAAAVREAQLARIAARLGPSARAKVAAVAAELRDVHPMQTVALGSVAADALRHLPPTELAELVACFHELAAADSRLSLREYCLARLAQRCAKDLLQPQRAQVEGTRRLRACATEARLVLAVLARFGHSDEGAAQRAFAAGASHLELTTQVGLAVPGDWPAALDHAFNALQTLRADHKRRLVQAMVRVMLHDERVTVNEAELLRAACALLRCPLPLVLAG